MTTSPGLTPARIAAVAGVGILSWWAIIAVACWLFLACATAPTSARIAADFAKNLDMLAGWPLAVKCQAVADAERRCVAAGFAADCAWDGWTDADRDSFTINACKQRQP